MSRGLNKVMLIGNVGRDPEVRSTPSGTTVATFSLATSDRWRDKNSGETKEETEWHRCVAFGKTGDVVRDYVAKGSQLFVEGKLKTRKWQDQSGADRYTTEINVLSVELLGGRGGSQGGGSGASSGASRAPQGGAQGGSQGGDFTPPPGDDFDDDIPFAMAWLAPLAVAVISGLSMVPGGVA